MGTVFGETQHIEIGLIQSLQHMSTAVYIVELEEINTYNFTYTPLYDRMTGKNRKEG